MHERERERVKYASAFYSKIRFALPVMTAVLGTAFLSPASAQAAVFKGDAFVRFTGTLGATVDFALRTENTDGTGADRAIWELDAGSSLTLYFRTADSNGAITEPNIPDGDGTDSCILRVYYETGTANLVRTLHSASTCPANGTSYTFHGTSDGTSGGSPRAGTLRLYVDVVQTNEITDNYNIDSDTDGDQGAVRSNVVVSDITKNAYPAGAKYAYGTAGNETMTFTVSATERYADRNVETFRVNTRRNSGDGLIENGSSQEWGTGGATTASFTADNTYDGSETTYDAEFEVVGSSGLLTSEKWTAVAVSSALFKSSSTAEKSALFVVDPRIYFSIDGIIANDNATSTYFIYNRGEVATSTFYLLNSRTEKLSRAMNISAVNSGSTVEGGPTSVTPSSNLYIFTYTIGSSDTAEADTTGSLKKLRSTNTDQTKDSNDVFGVSSLYYVDAHPQLNAILNADDWPTEDANETFTATIAADLFSFFAHVKNVRKDTNIDTSGSALTFTVKKPNGVISETFTSDTGSDGWTSNYDFSPVAPAGSWTITASTTFSGNSGTDTEILTFVSPFTGNYLIEHVGWNQTYNLGDTARFTIQAQERSVSTGNFIATSTDVVPTYTLRYWDGDLNQWTHIASSTMTANATSTGTYEATYAIPSMSAWAGRKVSFSMSAVIGGTRLNSAREIEIVSSPAQVVINGIADTTIPTISASVRITNEGTAAFEYTYEYCVVTSDTNQCGGGDDVAYGSAAKLIQAGANFDTTLTLNVADTGSYYFKVAVWWSNQSSKASRTFTATSDSGSSSSGGTSGGLSVAQAADQNTFAAVWKKIAEILSRLLGLEARMTNLEVRIATLEKQLGSRVIAQAPDKEIPSPKISRPQPKIQAPTPLFRIRLQ